MYNSRYKLSNKYIGLCKNVFGASILEVSMMCKFYLTASAQCMCSRRSNTRKLGQETC